MKNYSITKLKKSFLPTRAMIFMTTLSFALTTSITQAQETADVDITTHADIIPDGIGVGGKFRLLILNQLASPLSTFNDFATTNTRAAFIANQGHTDIRSFSSQFKALVSSSVTDARDNTGTKSGTHTDAPIYWLLGDKVADDYADFYDGSWDSRNRRNEQGTNNGNVGVITGSTSAGIVSTGNGVDSPGSRRQGTVHGAAGNELDNGTNYTSNFGNVRFLILSPVFTVTGTTTPTITISEVSGGYVNDAEDESDITISGVSTLIDDAQTITLTISDTDGTTADVTKTPTVTSNAWSTTLTSANIKGLAEGTITITAAYTGAPDTTQTFVYDITGPALVRSISDQTVTVGTGFSFSINPIDGTFSDISKPITSSSVGQRNGITFGGTDTWSGTPTVVETQTITITVTDRAGNSATYQFNINVVLATAPRITINTIEGDDVVNAAERTSVQISGTSTNIPDNGVIDLTFDVSAVTGGDATVRNNAWEYTIPQNQSVLLPNSQVTVTAEYTGATAVERTFDVDTVLPRLVTEIPDQTATIGTDFSYQIQSGTFTDANALTYTSSTLTNGLTFATDTWSGVGSSLTAGTVTVTVTATDVAGNTQTDEFTITIAAATSTIDTNPFITTWNTEAGDSGSTTIMLPISGGAYDVDTNNDGIFDLTNQTGTITIDFGTGNAGTKTIRVRANPTNNASNQLQINHFQAGTPQKLMRIDKWGDIVWTSMQTAFHSCSNMTIADDAGVPDLTMATSTHGMFASATNFTGDLSGWDVSNVINLSVMFAEATSFNSDLSSWNISSATNMRDMLRGATSFTTQNYNALLRGWSSLPSLQSDVTFGAPPTTYCDQGAAARDVLTNPPNNWDITGDSVCTPTIEDTGNYFISTWEAESGGENNFVQIPITGGNYDIDVNGDGSFDSAIDKKNVNGLTQVNLGTLGSDRRKTIRIRLSPTDDNPSTQLRMDHGLMGAAPERLISIQKWGDIVWSSMQNAFKDCTRVTIADDAGVPDLSMVTNMDAMFSGATSLTGDLSSWNVSGVTSMANMFTNASSFTTQDYDALLIGWSSLASLQPNVTFGAPPTNYCAGEEGRNTLTGAIADGGYNWTISGDTGKSCSDLLLSVDAFLQGPYTSSSMMSDGLREGTHIPTISPYGDENTIESDRTVLGVEGTDAIVDWVEISLHNRNNIGMVISTTPALLQRDGDVVGLNGTADLVISGAVGNYYVSINHRNHIPVITAAAKSLSTTNTAIDFTNDLTIVTGGSNAMAEVEVKSDNSKVYALFSGDVNGNGQIQVDDYNAAIQDVGRGGYLTSDVDMNGELQVSDINFVLKTLGKGAQF